MLTKYQLESIQKSKSIAEGCRQFGVSTSSFYRALERFRQSGAAGLRPKSRKPKHTRKTSKKIEAEIVRLARSGKYKHATEITRKLNEKGITIRSVTVRKILRSYNLYSDISLPRVRQEPERIINNT